MRELVSLASRYDEAAETPIECLEKFLESVALASEQDELKEEANAVRLMTVHAAKGLEFPYVFITGLEEGLFPYEREENDAADKEEERRLMYVALTRAEDKVYLSYAAYRTVFGSKNATIPSQFLTDIPEELISLEATRAAGPYDLSRITCSRKSPWASIFLTSTHYVGLIADAARIVPGETVLEIGPGEGVLTRELLARGAHVVAIEKDRRLIPVLQETFAKEIAEEKLLLIEADVLAFDPVNLPGAGPYKLVARTFRITLPARYLRNSFPQSASRKA